MSFGDCAPFGGEWPSACTGRPQEDVRMKLGSVMVFSATVLCLLLPAVMRADVVFDSKPGLALTTLACNSGVASASTLYAPSGCTIGTSVLSVPITPNGAWQAAIPGDTNAVW